MPVESVYDHRVERDTGQWLPIAESAQAVNNVCVAGEHSGGMDETGKVSKTDNLDHELTNIPRRQQETLDLPIPTGIAAG